MEAELTHVDPPNSKLRWLRRIALLVVLPAACLIFLLHAADRYAIILPVAWTAVWMNACVRAGRELKRDPERARTAGSRKPLSKLLAIPVAALFAFWTFGWALFVGLAYGPVAGLASLYLELFAALAAVFISQRAFAFCEKHGTSSLIRAIFIRLGLASH